jgi:hypothetical protein
MATKAKHSDKSKRKPLRLPNARTTLRLDRELDERMRHNASRMGLTVTDYLGALIRGEKPIAPPAAEGQCLALIGCRVAGALALIYRTEVELDRDKLREVLQDVQRLNVEYTRNLLPAYEAAVAARREHRGTDDHWGDLLPVE